MSTWNDLAYTQLLLMNDSSYDAAADDDDDDELSSKLGSRARLKCKAQSVSKHFEKVKPALSPPPLSLFYFNIVLLVIEIILYLIIR